MFKKLFPLSLVLIAALCLEGTLKSAEAAASCAELKIDCEGGYCGKFTGVNKTDCEHYSHSSRVTRKRACPAIVKQESCT